MPEINPEELTYTQEYDLSLIKKRAVKGVISLTGRTFLLQAISFFGFFLLSVFLNQSEIGLFFAVSELVAILGYFSDIGLAAALIQKKEEPDLKIVRSTFTLQQLLVTFLISLVLILTPWLKDFYHISSDGIWLLRALLLGFFLSSLKTIPSVLLERKLKFEYLVIVEVVETLVFYLISVFLAWLGKGVLSYAWAVFLRGVAGVILIYLIYPWKIGFSFDFSSLKSLLKFGVPYQLNSLLAVVKDRLMNVLLWRIVGADGVGILGWAQKWSQTPLRFFMDPIMKVTFPAYSRIQENKEELRKAIEKTLFFVSFFTFPVLTGLIILIKPLILLIPKYQKWEVAVFSFCFFCLNSAWGAITTPLTNALSAIGKIKKVFNLMIMWTVLTWIFYPLLGIKFGYNGVAVASFLVSLSSIIAIYITGRSIKFNFRASVIKPLLASLIMGITIFFSSGYLKTSLPGIILLVFLGIIVYFITTIVLTKKEIIQDIKSLVSSLKKKY